MKLSEISKKLNKTEQPEVFERPVEIEKPADVQKKEEAETTCETGENPPIGWVSPSYSKSQTVQLNPNILKQNRCITTFTDRPENEAYKVLRELIQQYAEKHGGNSIMLTSALPGEGKTLTAINLAFAFAREFEQTVLLVDCDLKKQNIHTVMGFKGERGLVDYLLGRCLITDLMIWPGIEKLTLISGGMTIEESSEILGSPRMKNLVDEMKNRYPNRYIIFDVPPILTSSDAMVFAGLVDQILVVVQADKTSMVDLNAALKMIPKDKIVGLVLNHQSGKSND
jgi:protein-tyrosine kinase